MPRFTAQGVDQKTGHSLEVTLEVDAPEHTRIKAHLQGVIVVEDLQSGQSRTITLEQADLSPSQDDSRPARAEETGRPSRWRSIMVGCGVLCCLGALTTVRFQGLAWPGITGGLAMLGVGLILYSLSLGDAQHQPSTPR